MSEKEKEEVVIDHFSHHHPLHLTEALTVYNQYCSGCRVSINRGDTVYRCTKGCGFPILHEECAEMPREIRVSMHPQHTLIQKEVPMQASASDCPVCKSRISKIGYCCTSSSCEFIIHVGCAQGMDIIMESILMHPSHPQHELKMLWSLGRSCLPRCDGCGTKERGNSYICIDCQYWIHESCASLPTTAYYHHHHSHPLSLVYHLPLEYIIYDFKCDICLKDLIPRYWAYHCRFCSYVVHIKCVAATINRANIVDEVGFPLKNSYAEVIGNFVTNVVGATTILDKGSKHKFQYHDHELHLISFDDHEEVEEEEEGEDSCNDYLNYRIKSELICDGCTTPILINKSPPPSSNKHCNYYMSCGECRYFLHVACFHLPPELPCHPLIHPKLDHNLTLQTTPKLEFTPCHICHYSTNGLFYACTQCDFKADIKCAFLPDAIKHAAHPRHLLKLLSEEATRNENYLERLCVACGGDDISDRVCYGCDICGFVVHSTCALLPAVVSNPEWEKHPLPLTFDATADYPSEFYCEICEQKMNPKIWMYHCRTCDFSLHPLCYPSASGKYRNIKFGQRYDVASVHPHPLRYQLLTTKLNCGVCGKRKDYGSLGFQCTSHNCDFFMCFNYYCGYSYSRKALMQAVD